MTIIFWLLKLTISVLPGFMLGLPVWAIVLIVGALSVLPIPFASELYWIAGLIGAICGQQDGFAIAYYILTILPVFTTIMNIIAFKKDNR